MRGETRILFFLYYKISEISIDEPVGEPQLEHFTSTQIYHDVPEDQPAHDPVGRPIMHQSGEKHVTGEALYSCDLQYPDMLYMAFVCSPVAAGTIDYVDITEALELPGVVSYIDHNDICVALDLMWSDPGADTCCNWQFNKLRNASWMFGTETVKEFCRLMNIDLIVRAHEVCRNGHMFYCDKLLCTVFSAPNYCGSDGNCASVMKVSADLTFSFIIL
uniref:Serine/threonine specific protein phosphatases domain-containing protein n=1 Tax=Panagrolaimus davidi TaxID=227884 RepID=A0A914P451_9BILA